MDSAGPSTSGDTYMCHHCQGEVINIVFTLTSTHTTLNVHLSTHVPLEMGCVYLCKLRHENSLSYRHQGHKVCAYVHNHQQYTHHPQDRLWVDLSQKQW